MNAKNSGRLIGAVVIWLLVAACSSQVDRDYVHLDDDSERADVYLTENFPTRDEMLSARECITERTGYEFAELPADYGPEYATKARPPDVRVPPDEVLDMHVVCVFDLGLENKFFPPWDHEELREAFNI